MIYRGILKVLQTKKKPQKTKKYSRPTHPRHRHVSQSENVRVPEGVVVLLLQLLHVGGAEVKLSAGRTADAVLVVTGLQTFARSGLKAERRQVCGATRRK